METLSYSVSTAATEALREQHNGRKTDHWFDGECKAATNANNKAYGLCSRESIPVRPWKHIAQQDARKIKYTEDEKGNTKIGKWKNWRSYAKRCRPETFINK
jgi:hypothetical protein